MLLLYGVEEWYLLSIRYFAWVPGFRLRLVAEENALRVNVIIARR